MDFLNMLNKTVSDAGQKTKDLADIASLSGKVSGNEKKIDKLYKEIGEIYFDAHGDDPEEAFNDLVGNIHDLMRQNDELEEQVQALKGLIKCPGCGEYVDKDSISCPNCGWSFLKEDEIVCPNCGKKLKKMMIFCQYCGMRIQNEPVEAPNTVKIAPSLVCICGTALDDGMRFCPNCGRSRMELESN